MRLFYEWQSLMFFAGEKGPNLQRESSQLESAQIQDKTTASDYKNINMVLSMRAINNLKKLSESLYKPQNKVIEDLIEEKLELLLNTEQIHQAPPPLWANQVNVPNLTSPAPLATPLSGADLYESETSHDIASTAGKISSV